MNRNFLIAIVIAAAAVIAYFILSSPSEADKAAAGATGLPGTGGLGTGAAPSGSSSDNPLAQLLNGVMGGGGVDAGLLPANDKTNIVIGRFNVPSIGWVKIYGDRFNPSNHKSYVIESTSEVVSPGTAKYDQIRSAIVSGGKITV